MGGGVPPPIDRVSYKVGASGLRSSEADGVDTLTGTLRSGDGDIKVLKEKAGHDSKEKCFHVAPVD